MLTTLLYAADSAVPRRSRAGPAVNDRVFNAAGSYLYSFYFMFIMPQRKEQKKLKEMMASLKVGDKVITNSRNSGHNIKILEKDDILVIKSGENTTINVLRPYVSRKIERRNFAGSGRGN